MDWYKKKKTAQMADLVATPGEMDEYQMGSVEVDGDVAIPIVEPAPVAQVAAPEPPKGPQPPHPLPPAPEKIAPGPKKNLFRRNVWRVQPGK